MEWTSEAIVVSTRKHGESDVILEVLTPEHGRHLGLVRGGKSRRYAAVLQPGNGVTVTWRARLATHLGHFSVELTRGRAADIMASGIALKALQHVSTLLRQLPEREVHRPLYQVLQVVMDHLDQPEVVAPLLVRFELLFLQEIGFGLDLERCAATGSTDDLAYVSPKSARAVSRDAGRPYHDRLLPLPSFLVEGQRQQGSEVTFQDVLDGFRLSSFFLEKCSENTVLAALTTTRSSMMEALEKSYRQSQPWNFLT